MAEKLDVEESEQYFGALYEYIVDDAITDVDVSGTPPEVWITSTKNERTRADGCGITQAFLEQFSKRVANTVSRAFNKAEPVLEAETDRLRITVVHESAAINGRAICIRKSLPYVRLKEEDMIMSGYASQEVIDLLKNCVKARMNLVFCGEPAAGKTECAKFFSSFIPAGDRVITIEDTPEWHYSTINPGKDCVELKVGEQMDYTRAIKTCLRLNPKWMMVSETRSKEVIYLVEGFSTGVRGMTTLHADDVRKVPDRMVNMAGQSRDEGRLENDIYSFINVAVMIRRREVTDEYGKRVVRRFIDQVCFFERKDGKNETVMIVDDGKLVNAVMPDDVRIKMKRAGIKNPFKYAEKPAQKDETDASDCRGRYGEQIAGDRNPGVYKNRDFCPETAYASVDPYATGGVYAAVG